MKTEKEKKIPRRFAITRQTAEGDIQLLRMFSVPHDWPGNPDALPNLGFLEVEERTYQGWLERTKNEAREKGYLGEGVLMTALLQPKTAIYDAIVEKAAEEVGRPLSPWNNEDSRVIQEFSEKIGIPIK